MALLTDLGFLLAIFGLILGVRVLKFEKGNKQETVVYGRDILALVLIGLGFSGGIVSVIAMQPATGVENAGTAGYQCGPSHNVLCAGPGGMGLNQKTLGVWYNMPAASTELFGNQSYRQVFFPQTAIKARLAVTCLAGSSHSGAKLTLQEATYSLITDTNSTVFTNVPNFANVPIDGSQGTCPGTLPSASGLLPLLANPSLQGYIFRVMGSGGGGAGDNPQFSNIQVELSEQVPILVELSTDTPTTTIVHVTVTTGFVDAASNYNIGFVWWAMNTTVGSGTFESGTQVVQITSGTTTSTATVTFSPAYVTFSPTVMVSLQNTGGAGGISVNVDVGALSLFNVETIAVLTP